MKRERERERETERERDTQRERERHTERKRRNTEPTTQPSIVYCKQLPTKHVQFRIRKQHCEK
jgi:hypothetical protein